MLLTEYLPVWLHFHVTLASVPAGFAADATEYYFDGAVELTITLQAE